jgi:hypothetical protein
MENTKVTRMTVASMLMCGGLIFKVQLEGKQMQGKTNDSKKKTMKA